MDLKVILFGIWRRVSETFPPPEQTLFEFVQKL